MNNRRIHRSTPHLASAALCLATCYALACNGELAVVDDVERQGSNLTGQEDSDDSSEPSGSDDSSEPSGSNDSSDSTEPSDSNDASDPQVSSPCACAQSPSLLALNCGAGEVPLLDNDIVQQTPDGSVAFFNVQLPDGSFQVLRWDGGPSATPLASGMLNGSSAAGVS